MPLGIHTPPPHGAITEKTLVGLSAQIQLLHTVGPCISHLHGRLAFAQIRHITSKPDAANNESKECAERVLAKRIVAATMGKSQVKTIATNPLDTRQHLPRFIEHAFPYSRKTLVLRGVPSQTNS